MPTLLEVQQSVGAFLTRADGQAADFILDDGVAPDARLAIYRNTYIGNLVGALRISYPAVLRLVGEEFFEGTARTYIDQQPPQSAYLNGYGARFGDFLAEFAPAQTLAYLPDVARLEWSVNIALHAEDVAPLDTARLTVSSEDVTFVGHPSVSLLQLRHAADAIWRAVLDGNDEALAAIVPSDDPFFVMVERRNEAVSVVRMNERDWRFARALFLGVPLSQALAEADADMTATLAEQLTAGRFIDMRFCDVPPERATP